MKFSELRLEGLTADEQIAVVSKALSADAELINDRALGRWIETPELRAWFKAECEKIRSESP